MEESLVYSIEQNKYSSRKIVLRKEMPDDKKRLEQIISSKLFDLKIEKENSEQPCFIERMDFITTKEISFNNSNNRPAYFVCIYGKNGFGKTSLFDGFESF